MSTGNLRSEFSYNYTINREKEGVVDIQFIYPPELTDKRGSLSEWLQWQKAFQNALSGLSPAIAAYGELGKTVMISFHEEEV